MVVNLSNDEDFTSNDGYMFLSQEMYYYNTQKETFEEKLSKMKLDKFKKDYPMFSNIEDIIRIVKSKIQIYNEDIMREVFLMKTSL